MYIYFFIKFQTCIKHAAQMLGPFTQTKYKFKFVLVYQYQYKYK